MVAAVADISAAAAAVLVFVAYIYNIIFMFCIHLRTYHECKLTYIVPGGECAKYGVEYGARTHKLLKNDPSHLTCTVDVPCHAQHHRSLGKNSLPCYLL